MAPQIEDGPAVGTHAEANPGARMSPEERIASLTAGLHAALEEAIESPARWQVLLDASATLWRYSGGNVALLMMQMAQRGTDEPSLVAGYKEWARHGRTVLRGEHALWIIAPRTASMQELRLPDGQRKLLPLSQAAPPDAVATGKKSVVTGWRGQAVFDVSQTEGMPLLVPRAGQQSDVDVDELWRSLTEVAGQHAFKLDVSRSQYGLTSGFTDFAERRIHVGAWMNPEERVAVLAHELGHVLLHGPEDRVGQLYGSSMDHRGLAEVEAESVAYTVLRAHGIDRSARSASYLAGWADAVISAEKDLRHDALDSRVPASRVDIAKSVLGRVTAATKGILAVSDPPGFGGKVAMIEADRRVVDVPTYAGVPGPGASMRGPELAGP
ncbi:ArdC-like ssDNA-binding domain-containing protein [Paenarthrobacter sp. AB444]|uniref:ArdC-like ssDNA-binding domain-containing protein n=1 Tax=Paenarthrobacter sp. AB444 TaxID=3025681 RepID=UPI0023652695|nr:ArdC-like ssDNA-binding domain-containing protein [Paenarthrobacter sp. AB444]MDD7833921.1 ArdC-like ssDNA-binding domain-containing protein [Paenarthrobacter sp. AB444]